MIIVTSLHRDYMPSNWAYYIPSWVDIWTYIGTMGLFMTFFLLFVRFQKLSAGIIQPLAQS